MKALPQSLRQQARLLREQGLSYPKIATALKVSNTAVFKWLNPDKAKQYYQNYYPTHKLHQKKWKRKKAGKEHFPLNLHANTKLFTPHFDFDFGYVLGVLYGDGCVYGDCVSLSTTKDWEFAQTFAVSLGKILNRKPFKIIKLKNGYYRVFTHRKMLAQWFRELSLPRLNSLLLENKEVAVGFLRGFFDSEGWISKRLDKKRYTYLYLRLCNKRRELLDLCKTTLLKHFNITSSLWNTLLKTQYAPNGCLLWYLEIQSQKAVRLFIKKIGTSIPRKLKHFEVEWKY